MKKNYSFTVLVVAMAAIISSLLSSCSYYVDPEAEKKVTDTPINLEVILDIKEADLLEDAFTRTNPIKVIGLRQECGAYSEVFIEDAYIDDYGHIVFLNNPHCWLKDRLMMFTAYWPADAAVTTDNYGRITGGNCIVAGHTVPMNPTIERKHHTISHDPLVLRAFNDPE